LVQVQPWPQEQFAPQPHERFVAALRGAAAGWQPQVQVSPGQAAQAQGTAWFDSFMVRLLGGSTTGCLR